MFQIELDKALPIEELSLREKANMMVTESVKGLCGIVAAANDEFLYGFDHPVRILICDIKQKQSHNSQMCWELKGEPGDYIFLVYLNNEKARIGYIVGFDSYDNLVERSRNGWVYCTKKARATAWHVVKPEPSEADW